MRPFLDLRRREDGARLWALADEVYDLVLELGGTISSRSTAPAWRGRRGSAGSTAGSTPSSAS